MGPCRRTLQRGQKTPSPNPRPRFTPAYGRPVWGNNPNKTYLSKWLGGHGGADARTFVNDGRQIVGIAGMRAKDPKGPAFCLCLVTTRNGAIAAADRESCQSSSGNDAKQRDHLLNGT